MIAVTLAAFAVTLFSFALDGYVATKILTLVALALLCFGNAISRRDSRLGIVCPFLIFSFSYLQYYIAAPLNTIFFHEYIVPSTIIYGHIPPDADGPLVRGLVTSIIGLIGVIVGYQLHAWASGRLPDSRPGGDWVFDEHRFWFVVWAALAISVGSYTIFLYQVGFTTFFNTQRELRAYLFETTGGLTIFFYFWEVSISLYSVYLIETHKENLRRAILIIVLLFIPPTVLLIVFLTGSRILVLRPALVVGLYLLLTTGRVRFGTRAAVLSMIAVFIAVAGGIVRRYVGLDLGLLLTEAPRFLDPAFTYGIVTQSLDFTVTHDIYLLLHERPYDLGYGDTYLKVIYQFIPRTFWPDKPLNITIIAAQIFRPDQWAKGVSYSSSMFGEMYYNFGQWGVGVLCLGVGVALSALTRFGCRCGDNPPLRLIYAALVVSIIEHGRGGFSDTLDTYLIYYVLPTLFVSRRRVIVPRGAVSESGATAG